MRHELTGKLYQPGDSTAAWWMPIGNHEELYLSYRVRFVGDDWDGPWYSGKLPGFCGGICTGSAYPPMNYEGFSTRYMFQMSSDRNEIHFYLYHAGMIIDDGWGPYGDWLGVQDDYPINEWHTVTQRVVMNTPGTPNGIIEGFYDGMMVSQKTDMDYRNDTSFQYIETLYFANLLGGSGENPYDYGDTPTVDFDDFFIYTYKDSVPGIPQGLEPSPPGRVIEIPQFGVQS